MENIKLLSLVTTALVGLTQAAWAGPHGGGGGFASGGHFSGGGNFGGGHSTGGSHAAPAFSNGSARFGGARGGSFGGAPHFYSNGTRMSPIGPRTFTDPTSRSITSYAGRTQAINRQPNRDGSVAGGNVGVSSSGVARTPDRQVFSNNHVIARHDGNWRRDWDRRRAHYWSGHWWRYYGGDWIGFDTGFYPFDYYAYGYDPYGYYGYPYNDYGDYYPYDYDDGSGYAASDQYTNAVVSAVQSQLAKLGYYRGAIDGVSGPQTQDAIARYQNDRRLSVTGTLTAATLQSLGIS